MKMQVRNIAAMIKKSKTHKVRKDRGSDISYTVTSGGSGNDYRVHIYSNGSTCTCDWGKGRWVNADGRSACSHVLAVYRRRASAKGLQLQVFNSSREARAVKKAKKLYVGDSVYITLSKKVKRSRS